VVDYPLNLTLLLQVLDSKSCKTAVDFEPLNEDTLGDETESGNFLYDTVVGGLVDVDNVLGLVLDFSLGPLLLLGSFSATGGRRGFCLGLECEDLRSAKGHPNPSKRIQGKNRFPSLKSIQHSPKNPTRAI